MMTAKHEEQTMELENGGDSSCDETNLIVDVSDAERKAILRKMDMRIPPVLALLYCMSSMLSSLTPI